MPSATTTDGRTLDSRAAQQSATAFQRSTNNPSWTPPILARTARIRDEERVHVFSVSPWGDTVPMGAWGSFIIPPCPENKEYVEFLMHDSDGKQKAIPGIMMQTYRSDVDRNAWHEEDGREWAEKLLNNDVGISPAFSRNRVGMFVAKGDKPTKGELEDANLELQMYMEERITEAREWHSDPIKKQGITRAVHWLSARRLNLTDEAWMTSENPKGRQKCKLCGSYSDPDVVMCANNHPPYIFDHAAYAQIQADQAKQLAAAKV